MRPLCGELNTAELPSRAGRNTVKAGVKQSDRHGDTDLRGLSDLLIGKNDDAHWATDACSGQSPIGFFRERQPRAAPVFICGLRFASIVKAQMQGGPPLREPCGHEKSATGLDNGEDSSGGR